MAISHSPIEGISIDQLGHSLDQLFRAAIANGDLVGGVAMAGTADSLLYQGAFGWRDRETGRESAIDDVVMLASLTKTVTAVAAMQLVERGILDLDEPIGRVLPHLAKPQVLEAFAEDGAPILRPARQQITLRRLLSHTSGLGHEIWDAPLLRYQAMTGTPGLASRTNASLNMPLLSEPGEQWRYSIGLEWTGKVIEAVTGMTLGSYLHDNIFQPLGMHDTGFGILPQHAGRLSSVYQREQDGTLRPTESTSRSSRPGEYEAGGGGLYGTAPEFFRFLSLFLNEGRVGSIEILSPATVKLMGENQISELLVNPMRTAQPTLSNDFELYPGMPKGWGLSGMITHKPGPNGRSAGSVAWGGLANCYFWLDPSRELAALFLTQILPFGDARSLNVLGGFERELYRALG
jgi:methyl acetate hydrolase